MGNSLLRELSCVGKNQRKNRKENRGVKRKRQDMATVEGETPGQDKESKEFLSTSKQESGGSEEVCYTVISHPTRRRPSLNSNNDGYENVDCSPRRVRRSGTASETEYALLRTSAAGPTSCTPEPDYELVLPR